MNAEQFLEKTQTTIERDLKLNFKKITQESALTPAEAQLAVLALATSLEYEMFAQSAREKLPSLDVTEEQIREAGESAAIMGMLNIYYRFRTLVKGETSDEDYRTAGLRMTSLARPVLGKERFEMLAFTVSVLNGCHSCVKAHEETLKAAGVGIDKIHDLARLAAVMKGLKALSHTV